ncbi:hypothetical protein [Terricaulis sp.]|uniref:hypothetical protein n=1 Tax=Terricaulis sp. TaxID=2768686 RepID=UPI0037848419
MAGIDQRIPDLSDKELEQLHANAVRLAQSGTQVQRQRAEELLPLIGAAMEERRAARAAASGEKRRVAVRRKPVAAKEDPQ